MLEQQQPQRTQNLQQGDEAAIIERVRQRQLAELAAMEAARPIPDDLQYCAPYNAYGLTSIGWLLMGWREQMVIRSEKGAFTGERKLRQIGHPKIMSNLGCPVFGVNFRVSN